MGVSKRPTVLKSNIVKYRLKLCINTLTYHKILWYSWLKRLSSKQRALSSNLSSIIKFLNYFWGVWEYFKT